MRNRMAVALFALFIAFTASAEWPRPEIWEITPSLIELASGEHFITVRGNYFYQGFRVHVRFSGPGGTFTLYPNSGSNSTLYCWVPAEVVNTAGFYDVVVKNDSDHGEPAQESLPFKIEVRGTPAPRLQVPHDFAREATGPDGAVVTYEVSATSTEGKALTPDCAPLSGTLFKIGTTTVNCSVNDPDGSRQTADFKISVRDTTAPFMTVPDDITVRATSSDGAFVHFDVTATDIVSGTVNGYCTPSSGALFAIGTTQVHCWAFDAFSNSAYGTFKVTVTTAPPPVLHLPRDISVEATSSAGAKVTYEATADDGSEVTCTPPSGSVFPLGTTAVACSAGTASGTFNVNVIDSVRPVIRRITATPDRLFPVDHKFVSVHISVTASDSVDASPSSRIINVETNEPVTPDDWRITSALTVDLRAERNGQERDRIYTIVIETSDDSGNTSTGRVAVTVPHDQSNNGTFRPTKRRRSVRR
jgi:hypothetical protein